MAEIEEFSVRELADFRRYSRERNNQGLEDLVATNLAISDIRGYELEPDYVEMTKDQALSLLIHDSAIKAYENNFEGDQDEFYSFLADDMNSQVEKAQGLEDDILLTENVYGRPVSGVVEDIARYYAQNFSSGTDVETEKVLENNGFFGRADIIRVVDEDRELRDIKTRYSEKTPLPRPEDEFKMGCYALISREGMDIDRFVLEYPVQGLEIEVEPTEFFGEIVEQAENFEELLETSRSRQAQLLEEAMDVENNGDPRDFVEGLNLGYSTNRDFAESALSEGLELNG